MQQSKEFNLFKKEWFEQIIYILRQQLTRFQSLDFIILGEDFNSRAGTEPDFITENENDFHFYQKDTNKT